MGAQNGEGGFRMTATGFNRAQIRGWIEEATGAGLSVGDALPDTLAAVAESLGLGPDELRLWIFEHALVTVGPADWSVRSLVRWARRGATI